MIFDDSVSRKISYIIMISLVHSFEKCLLELFWVYMIPSSFKMSMISTVRIHFIT